MREAEQQRLAHDQVMAEAERLQLLQEEEENETEKRLAKKSVSRVSLTTHKPIPTGAMMSCCCG